MRWHLSFSCPFWVAAVEWLVALSWISRSAATLYHARDVPDLLDPLYGEPEQNDSSPGHAAALRQQALWPPTAPSDEPRSTWLPSGSPHLSVIVPALNEAAAIGTCLRSLLASRGLHLEILAIDDRSTDATGSIMESVAEEASSHSLRVFHVAELPAGWLGKPHALALGARHAAAPWLLFTDADAFYAPDALARSMRLLEQQTTDHLVLLPTAILKSAGERMMLSMMQTLSIWPVRLWKVADPAASEAIGVGCFNLVRRTAYAGIGGFEALPMEVLEDLRLGYLIKEQGYRQRVAYGRDLLRLHWAPGALGIVHNLGKNFYALCRYQPLVLVAAPGGTALLTLAPFLGLLGPWAVRLPSALALLTILSLYVRDVGRTRIPAWYGALFPLASCLFLYGMLRSALLTELRGGVVWRGTLYPLAELRRNAGPLHRRPWSRPRSSRPQ